MLVPAAADHEGADEGDNHCDRQPVPPLELFDNEGHHHGLGHEPDGADRRNHAGLGRRVFQRGQDAGKPGGIGVNGDISGEPHGEEQQDPPEIERVREQFPVRQFRRRSRIRHCGRRIGLLQRAAAQRPLLHGRDDHVGLFGPAAGQQPARRFGQLEPQQDSDGGQDGTDSVHPPPTIVEVGPGHSEGQTLRPGGCRRREPQAEPNAEEGAECGHDENNRGELRPGAPRGHLIDVGIHDRQVGPDAQTGDGAGDIEVEVVGGEGGVERSEAGDQHGDQQHVAPADAVRNGREDQRADDVAGQIQHHRQRQRAQRRFRSAARMDLHAGLDE